MYKIIQDSIEHSVFERERVLIIAADRSMLCFRIKLWTLSDQARGGKPLQGEKKENHTKSDIKPADTAKVLRWPVTARKRRVEQRRHPACAGFRRASLPLRE